MIAPLWDNIDSLRKLSHILMWTAGLFAIFAAFSTVGRYYIDRRVGQLSKVPFEYQKMLGQDPEKIYLNKTPVQLWSDLEPLTPGASESLKLTYTNQWIAFRAPVSSVYIGDDFGYIDFDNGQMKTRMSVDADQLPRLQDLRKGVTVSIEGKFNVIWDGYSNFTQSKLLD
jgi:hypothetical protein